MGGKVRYMMAEKPTLVALSTPPSIELLLLANESSKFILWHFLPSISQVIIDEENRRYFKQQEVVLYRHKLV